MDGGIRLVVGGYFGVGVLDVDHENAPHMTDLDQCILFYTSIMHPYSE
jgi:hypothetical protein